MDGTESAALAQAGKQLFMAKLLLTAMQYLWIYDYLLTLEDEIQYAWSGGRTWVFGLFIANRYTPLVHLIWVQFNMFHYLQPYTKWVPVFHAVATTAFAQIAVAMRVYAITRKNKLIGGGLALVVVAGIVHGIFSIFWIGLGPLQPLPDVNLDVFKICIYKLWTIGELLYYSWAMFFDVVVFLIILATTRRTRMSRYPGTLTILNTLLRDATYYFVLIFSVHFMSLLFLFVTQEEVQLLPAMANTILIPIMASRLMLSLKKASLEPKVPWSLETMSNTSSGTSAQGGTLHLAPRLLGRLRDSLVPGGEGIKLEATPRSPGNCGVQLAC